MEKKRTKIAYFTAVGVFLVLLVVLGLTYRETPLPTLEVEGEPVLADTPLPVPSGPCCRPSWPSCWP